MGKHVKSFVTEVKKNRALFVMAMPAFLLVLIMQYLPMSGLVLAFKNYRYDLGVFGSEWNGFANFEYLFSSGTGWLITKNTVVYNLLNLVTSQLIAVLIAIFISEINTVHYLLTVLYFLGYRWCIRLQHLQLRNRYPEQRSYFLRS